MEGHRISTTTLGFNPCLPYCFIGHCCIYQSSWPIRFWSQHQKLGLQIHPSGPSLTQILEIQFSWFVFQPHPVVLLLFPSGPFPSTPFSSTLPASFPPSQHLFTSGVFQLTSTPHIQCDVWGDFPIVNWKFVQTNVVLKHPPSVSPQSHLIQGFSIGALVYYRVFSCMPGIYSLDINTIKLPIVIKANDTYRIVSHSMENNDIQTLFKQW